MNNRNTKPENDYNKRPNSVFSSQIRQAKGLDSIDDGFCLSDIGWLCHAYTNKAYMIVNEKRHFNLNEVVREPNGNIRFTKEGKSIPVLDLKKNLFTPSRYGTFNWWAQIQSFTFVHGLWQDIIQYRGFYMMIYTNKSADDGRTFLVNLDGNSHKIREVTKKELFETFYVNFNLGKIELIDNLDCGCWREEYKNPDKIEWDP